MTKKDILRIIESDPCIAEARRKRARREQLNRIVSLLNDYISGKVSSVVIVGSTPDGGARYSFTDCSNTDVLILLGMVKKLETELVKQLKV